MRKCILDHLRRRKHYVYIWKQDGKQLVPPDVHELCVGHLGVKLPQIGIKPWMWMQSGNLKMIAHKIQSAKKICHCYMRVVKYFQLVENTSKMMLKWRGLGMFNKDYGNGKGATLCNRVMLESSYKYYYYSARHQTIMLLLSYLWLALSALPTDSPNTTFPLAYLHPLSIYWSLYLHPNLSYAYKRLSAHNSIWGCCWLPLFRVE